MLPILWSARMLVKQESAVVPSSQSGRNDGGGRAEMGVGGGKSRWQELRVANDWRGHASGDDDDQSGCRGFDSPTTQSPPLPVQIGSRPLATATAATSPPAPGINRGAAAEPTLSAASGFVETKWQPGLSCRAKEAAARLLKVNCPAASTLKCQSVDTVGIRAAARECRQRREPSSPTTTAANGC